MPAGFTATRRRLSDLEQLADRLRDVLVPQKYEPKTIFSRADYGMAIALAVLATGIAVWGFSQFDPRVYEYWNIYFQADPNRVLADMTERHVEGFERKGGVRPIFSILTFPLMKSLLALGLEKASAARILVVACAAPSAGGIYLALRGLGLPMHAALAFGAAFLASATFIHWFAFIETYAFAALTIVVMLFVATNSRSGVHWTWVAASASTLSIAVTNWAIALAASFCRIGLRPFVKVTTAAFLLVTAIACLQRLVFPTATLFFDPRVLKGELNHTQIKMERAGYFRWTPDLNIRSLLITSAVAPPPRVEDAPTVVGVFRVVNNQYTPITHTSPAGIGAIACWVFLLGMGVWGAWGNIPRRAVTIPVAAYIGFQVALHSVYGEITFLYSGHFFPALLMLAALGWFTPARRLVMCATVAFTILAGVNNRAEFLSAVRLSNEIAANYSGIMARPARE